MRIAPRRLLSVVTASLVVLASLVGAPWAAQAVTPSTFAITGSVSGAGAEGATATVRALWKSSTGTWTQGATTTVPYGEFSLTVSSAHSYAVELISSDTSVPMIVYGTDPVPRGTSLKNVTGMSLVGSATGALEASFQQGYSLSGIVTNASSQGVPSTKVTIVSLWGDDVVSVTSGADTGSGSPYEFQGVPAGSVYVRFDASGYATQYSGLVDTTNWGLATAVTLGDPADVTGLDAVLNPKPGSLSGVAKSYGNLTGLVVDLYRDLDGFTKVDSTPTDDVGGWSLPSVPPGVYRIGFHDTKGVFPDQFTGGIRASDPNLSTLHDITVGVGAKVVVNTTLATRAFTTHPAPKISGKALQYQKLTATVSGWSPSGTWYSYAWKRNGVAIAGATLGTHWVVAADAGKHLTVTVTGHRRGYLSAVTSTGVVAHGVLTSQTPWITGTFAVGKTLSAHTGTWTTGTKFAYRWTAGGKTITGATSSTLKLTTSMKGKSIMLIVTGTKTGYITVREPSGSSPKIGSPTSCSTTQQCG